MSDLTLSRIEELYGTPTEELCETASAVLTDLCTGRAKWTMRIPPTRHDPDLVFAEVIRRLSTLNSSYEGRSCDD